MESYDLLHKLRKDLMRYTKVVAYVVASLLALNQELLTESGEADGTHRAPDDTHGICLSTSLTSLTSYTFTNAEPRQSLDSASLASLPRRVVIELHSDV